MGDVETKKNDSETKQATVFAAARKAVEEHEARLNESIAVPRAGETGAVGGTSPKWKLESSFAPKKEASSEMTMEELGVWLRTFEAYREVSRLQYTLFSVQKAAFLQCISVELQTKLDFSHAHDIEACIELVTADFKRRNPRLVLRHQWLKVKQRKDENWSDFQAREYALRKNADVHDMTPDQLIAHVLMAGCTNEELLKKLLEIGEDELTEVKIRQVAEKFEVMTSTAAGLTNKGADVRVKQVKGGQGGGKDMDKITCYLCRAKGHFAKECKIERKICRACGAIQREFTIPMISVSRRLQSGRRVENPRRERLTK